MLRPPLGERLGPGGGSAWRSSRPCFGAGLPLQGGQIGKRHDPDEAFIAAHHRQAANPPTPHLFRHLLDALALETIQHVGGHCLAYGGLSRVPALCGDLDGDIMAGDRSDQPIVFADRERSGSRGSPSDAPQSSKYRWGLPSRGRASSRRRFRAILPSPPSEASYNRRTSVEHHSSRSRRRGIGARHHPPRCDRGVAGSCESVSGERAPNRDLRRARVARPDAKLGPAR